MRRVSAIRFRDGRVGHVLPRFKKARFDPQGSPLKNVEQIKRTIYQCRLCKRWHKGWTYDASKTSLPWDEHGNPLVCHDCSYRKLSRKGANLWSPKRRGPTWREHMDRHHLYTVAKLYLQEYAKARKEKRI